MARIPLTEEQVAEDFVILNLENVALTDEQFIELCSDNRDFFHLELTAQKELVIMTPPGIRTGRRNTIISTDLDHWARKDGKGIVYGPLSLFGLPNGARRSPDASWVRRDRFDFSRSEEVEIGMLCPDFVVELMSPSDKRPVRFRMLQAKMDEYIANGAQLGWLIDPFKKKVYVYGAGKPVEVLDNPTIIYGDPVLPGFAFDITQVWNLEF